MTSAIRSMGMVQIGKESAAGDAVNATRRIVTDSATYRRLETFERFLNQITSSLTGPWTTPIPTRLGTEFELTQSMDFEQILWALLSGVKGSVTPSTPGSGNARLWTFTPSPMDDPAPESYTLEWVDRSPGYEAEMEATYVFCTGYTIAVTNEGTPQLTMRFHGRKTTDGDKTGGIAVPTLHYRSAAQYAVWFDDTWAALGTNQVSAQILGFTFTFGPWLRPAHYLDGRSQLDFSKYEFGGLRPYDLTMEVVHDPSASAFTQLEEADKSAGTKRFVRLKLTGANFAAPDAAYTYHVQHDLCLVHADDSMQDRGADRDGNLVTSMHFTPFYDVTAAKDIEVTVQNILTAFP